MMFAILFGLSMDYEVFLMTHIRERFMATEDAHEGVVDGLAGTARVITSAALIMVSVFLAFLLSGDPTIKQFGLGMAAAVAIDATLIRCVLVPAVDDPARPCRVVDAALARSGDAGHLDRGRGVLPQHGPRRCRGRRVLGRGILGRPSSLRTDAGVRPRRLTTMRGSSTAGVQ